MQSKNTTTANSKQSPKQPRGREMKGFLAPPSELVLEVYMPEPRYLDSSPTWVPSPSVTELHMLTRPPEVVRGAQQKAKK